MGRKQEYDLPTAKTSQMQSCQESLTTNLETKAGTYQASPNVSHQGPRISRPNRCDGWRRAKRIRSAMGKGNGKGHDVTGQDSD